MATWYSVETPQAAARYTAAWGGLDAPADEVGAMLLHIAREQVLEFAPAPLNGDDYTEVPPNLVYAQLQQARNLWNAGRAQGDGNVGPEGYSFVPRPLDKTIKQIIRPLRGVPDVF